MKNFLILLFMVGCATQPITKVEDANQVAVEVLDPSNKQIKIEIKSLTGFNNSQAERFRKIVKNCETVINTKDFATQILNFKYQNKFHFVDTEDSNLKVLETVLSKDWVLQYKLEWLLAKSTIGYTYPNVEWIALNSRQYPYLTDADVCGNIVHEYGGHKLGRYSHAQKANASRPYSVPYGIGNIAKNIYKASF